MITTRWGAESGPCQFGKSVSVVDSWYDQFHAKKSKVKEGTISSLLFAFHLQ